MITNNNLSYIDLDDFEYLNLTWVELSNNSLTFEGQMFPAVPNLKQLDLQGNRIRYIHPNAFRRLYRLERLNLAFNPMQCIPEDLFRVKTLLSLNLDDIEIENIDVEMFSYASKLEFVYFKKFYYCSYTPEVKNCKPTTDGKYLQNIYKICIYEDSNNNV
ncbi:hypothetical protein C0J52_14895 [Blattella germanica]|nr:hypothetical protein C0J52_14895 [Blattella germanica]